MIGVIFAAMLSTAPTLDPACAYDPVAMLALSPDKFDQDMQGGWRPLADKPPCEAAAAELLAAYRKAHLGTLKPNELSISYWHEGQIYAELGQNRTAIPLLLASISPSAIEGWEEYARGTVAFLARDLAALKAERDRLASRPKPVWFDASVSDAQARFGITPRWPPNLDVLDGFIACFDKPYKQAYEYKCRPKAPAS